MTNTPYDLIAAWYDQQTRSLPLSEMLIFPYLPQLLDNIHSLSVCDLGCGQGIVSRWLAKQGAHVIGVDLSSALLNIAQQYEDNQPLNITYHQDDAASLATLSDVFFDGLIRNLALMDMSNLQAVFNAVWRVLKSNGWFIFSLTHPCFQPPMLISNIWKMAQLTELLITISKRDFSSPVILKVFVGKLVLIIKPWQPI